MSKNFGYNTIETRHKELDKNMPFEFAEYEYQRHLRNSKMMHALPYLKKMAEQAQTPKQRNLFQMHVVAGIVSGLRWNTTDGTTKGRIKDICRTR